MSKFIKRAMTLSISVLALAGISCEQFEYASPLPGILEIRLATKHNRQVLLPFNNDNLFTLNLRSLEVRQPGGVRLLVFASLQAIRRNPDGDTYNTLTFDSRDSVTLLGVAYAPPGIFTGIDMSVNPGPFLYKSFGSYGTIFNVVVVPPFQLFQKFGDLNIPIEEGRVTVVTVTFDMDQSLTPRISPSEDFFSYVPKFYVSSVRMQ